MPTYVYSSKDKTATYACACKWPGYVVVQKFHDDPLTECPSCGGEVYRSIRSCRFQFRYSQRGDMRDYREDLARFPNDPEALVDGPRALSKLMDKRKREGWEFSRDLSDHYDGLKGSATGEIGNVPQNDEIMKEAYEAARAEGFSLDTPTVREFLDDSEE